MSRPVDISSFPDISRCPIYIRSKISSINLILPTMLLQATIIRNYFVKTQTSMASFRPPDLSIMF